ncbi:MAG TPA: helix-turn-helix domain-containing protein [Rhizomicrobium sp.]|nr:helix-turn-helix domain-containing protein [Rhizomicrobium sp.]
MAQKEKRIRRRPEDARALILDAAEAQMTVDGPAGLRLQDVARAAGVSHPTILHHFGSREGLVRALNQRSLEALRASVLAQLGSDEPGGDSIHRAFAAYRDGMAQRVLWLIQSSEPSAPVGLKFFDEVVEALQAVRLKFAQPGTVPDIEDTRAVIHLTTLAAFGDAVIGPRLRQGNGAKERAQRDRFEKWFAALIDLYLIDKAGLR